MIRKIVLTSEESFHNRIPVKPIGNLLRNLPIFSEQVVRMAFNGRSSALGRKPRWVARASDIRLLDISSDHTTVLRFDVPKLGDAAGEIYSQEQLFSTRPDPDETAIDLLGHVFMDLDNNNPDSNLFDPPLLKNLSSFRNVINGYYKQLDIFGREFKAKSPAFLNEHTIQTAQNFYWSTPAPVKARIVGELDAIRGSNRSFILKLDNDEIVRGYLESGEMKDYVQFFQKRVLVLGDAIFRTSKKLLRIDAKSIEHAKNESSVWSRSPQPMEQTLADWNLHSLQGPRSGVSAIFGKWPGDESDEEIEEMLREIS